jgi:hypothetical protein
MTRSGPVEIAFPRIYALLKAAGVHPWTAVAILTDARNNRPRARLWIGAIAASRWRRRSAAA